MKQAENSYDVKEHAQPRLAKVKLHCIVNEITNVLSARCKHAEDG